MDALVKKATALLASFGYTVEAADKFSLGFVLQTVVQGILADINHEKLPAALENVAVNRAAGAFLQARKACGGLEGFELDEQAVKSWSEGDTTVTFATGEATQTPEQRLDALILALQECGKGLEACFRRLRW